MNPIRPLSQTLNRCRWCFVRRAARQASSIAPGRQSNAADKFKIPDYPARTRFAPSPTGYLHLGSLRTALYNYLLAKATGGQFLLRLEDTDTKRTVQDAEKRLYEDLRWAGLFWDEGPEVGGHFGPYRQSERTEIYRKHATKLIESGHAYRCFCSPERLASLAEERSKLGLPTDYDRTCASIPAFESEQRASEGQTHTVRLKVPDVYPIFKDIVYGSARRQTVMPKRHVQAWEDPILLKSDGLPTYNLANVVDDHHMRITHVVRGTEWMGMTPKHLAIYQAFGWDPPLYAHVPLLTDEGGAKLSKRTGSTYVRSFRDDGFVPEALVNFVALLGWSHGHESDVMTLLELIENFNLKFTKGNATINPKKLSFLQRKHIERLIEQNEDSASITELVERMKASVLSRPEWTSDCDTILAGRDLGEYITAIFRADAANFRSVDDFVSRNIFFFVEPVLAEPFTPSSVTYPLSFVEAKLVTDVLVDALQSHEPLQLAATVAVAADRIMEIRRNNMSRSQTHSNAGKAEDALKEKENKSTKGQIYDFLRLAITEGRRGVTMKQTTEILGEKAVKRRLKAALTSYPTE